MEWWCCAFAWWNDTWYWANWRLHSGHACCVLGSEQLIWKRNSTLPEYLVPTLYRNEFARYFDCQYHHFNSCQQRPGFIDRSALILPPSSSRTQQTPSSFLLPPSSTASFPQSSSFFLLANSLSPPAQKAPSFFLLLISFSLYLD